MKKLYLLCFVLFGFFGSSIIFAEDAKSFNWFEFGDSLKDKGPSNETAKAKFLVSKVVQKLIDLKIDPNVSALDRPKSLYKHGGATYGTCDDISELLDSVFNGAEYGNDKIFKILGQMGLNESIKKWAAVQGMNTEHVVFGVFADGEPITFDLWIHGTDERKFEGFQNSMLNGLPVSSWVNLMKLNKYSKFIIDPSKSTEIKVSSPERVDAELKLRISKKVINLKLKRRKRRDTKKITVKKRTEEKPVKKSVPVKVITPPKIIDETSMIVNEFKALYPKWLEKNLAPDKEEDGRIVVLANAVKIGPNKYKVASEIWRTPKFGPKKGKEYRSSSADYVMTLGQLKAAIVQYKKYLEKNK